MENIWHLNNHSTDNGKITMHGQNNDSTTNPHHHAWKLGNFLDVASTTTTTTTAHCFEKGGIYSLMFPYHHHLFSSSSISPDSHLTCLKLGKRHYVEDSNNLVAINREQEFEVIKKVRKLIDGKEQFLRGGGGLIWRRLSSWPTKRAGPRCQVEGCSVMLVNAKEYHRRHKVCEKHSKVPKAIVLGIEQRFCQQCSRFHAICEFDESKRSCRRRLAGHNERRRKTYQCQSPPTNLTSDKVMSGGCRHSANNTKYNSSPDLSEQSSAALREFIVENRTAVLGWQVHDTNRHSWRNHLMEDQNVLRITDFAESDMNGAHLSLEPQASSKFI